MVRALTFIKCPYRHTHLSPLLPAHPNYTAHDIHSFETQYGRTKPRYAIYPNTEINPEPSTTSSEHSSISQPTTMDPKRRKMGDADVGDLRERSRQTYLQKREAEQLALLRKQVAEETEELSTHGDRLSAQERADFARNRETLRLAEARNAIDEHLDGYTLPDADYTNKSEALTRKHKEKGYEKSEVQLWEEEQTKRVSSQIKKPERVSAEDYEYVFDTEQNINFDGPMVDLERQRLQENLDEAEKKVKTIEETRKSLPIYQYKDEFLQAVKDHQIIVLVGQTGSGKTTQLTQYLQESGYGKSGKIGCTQPRRVAAISVANRVAQEAGTRVGRKVGYSVRFESAVSDETEIEYMTDGLALRLCLTDPSLSAYSVIILDEAHERTLATDILMSLVKEVSVHRPEFRLIIASATLAAQKFSEFFFDAPIMNIPGRTFPITTAHASSPEANYLSAAVTTIFQVHLSNPPNNHGSDSKGSDILCFFTGEEEILAAADYINDTQKKLGSRSPPLIVAPVYGALPSEAQQLIFNPAPPGSRKVVLATNIAETSLTIDGISYVIDCGLEKQSSYQSSTQMDTLQVVPCSRASAQQRSGRAGRTGPGMAFRLYTKFSYFNEMPESTLPEILRISLDGPVLTLKAMGINDLLNFDFMDAPPVEALAASLETIYALGYLDSNGAVTKLGRRASELPLDPRLAKVLLTAESLGCVDEIITLVAMVQEAGTLFFAPKDKKVAAEHAKARFTSSVASTGGDLIAFLNVWNEFVENEYSVTFCRDNFVQYRVLNRVRDVRDQLEKLCERVDIPKSSCGVHDHSRILKAFTAGYFANVARLNRDGQTYRTLKQGLSVNIHPSSCLRDVRPKLIVFAELVLTSKEFARTCAPIDPAWLGEMAPHYYKQKDIDNLDVGRKTGKGPRQAGVGR
jgi:pre-mRNA-splicing factor ATP-dependent RNA helicase DHX16